MSSAATDDCSATVTDLPALFTSAAVFLAVFSPFWQPLTNDEDFPVTTESGEMQN